MLLLLLGEYTFPVVAVRSDEAAALNKAWKRKTVEFCLSAPQRVDCEGEKVSMEILQAAYSRKAHAPSGDKCESLAQGTWESCEVDAKEMVKRQCEGTQECHLIPTDHAHCAGNAFLMMRLKIQCSAGEPRPEPPRLHSDGMTLTAIPIAPDMAELAHQAAHLPEAAEQYLPGAATQLLHDFRVSTTSENPVVIQGLHAQKTVKRKVTSELENPFLVGIGLVPCFRWTRLQKFGNGEVFGDWQSWELLARLTNCGVQEGCFHVTFPNGTVYTDHEKPPTNAALVQAALTEAPDSYWVTFGGTGLKRNDYGTWGVCLPKTSDMQLAVELWDSMKKGSAADKVDMTLQEFVRKWKHLGYHFQSSTGLWDVDF